MTGDLGLNTELQGMEMNQLELHKFQHAGIDFWLNNPRTYYAIDMGLGKTAMVLHALTRIKEPALVLAPLTPVYNTWPDEIRKWKIPLKYSIVHGPNKIRAIQRKDVDIFLTNYETIPFIYDFLEGCVRKKKKFPFSVLVIDEGTKIKSPSTKRHDYLQAMRSVFPKWRVILSGTPSPNALYDLWAQYYILDDGKSLGPNFHAFRRKHYEQYPWDHYGWYIREGADDKIHRAVAPRTFRLDEKDHLKMPPLQYNYIKLNLPPRLKKQYKKFTEEFVLEVKGIEVAALSQAALQTKLRQFLQGFLYYYDNPDPKAKRKVRKTVDLHKLKLNMLKELVDSTGQPILCAIQFHHELAQIRKVFPGTPAIVGGMQAREKSKLVREWNKGKIPLLICHPASLSHGANIQTGGHIIVWYCLPWSLELHQQFNKRLHRQGQKHGVIIHYLLVRGTIDAQVAHVLNQKDMTQRKLLDFLRDHTNY